jgi:hypothetical protein
MIAMAVGGDHRDHQLQWQNATDASSTLCTSNSVGFL